MQDNKDPVILKSVEACDIFLPYDQIFTQYETMIDLDGICRQTGMSRRTENCIIAKWPWGMKKAAGDPGAQDEFDTILATSLLGKGWIVEWVNWQRPRGFQPK